MTCIAAERAAAVLLLREIQTAGIRARIDGGDLVVTPKSAVTHELRARMHELKPALIAELHGQHLTVSAIDAELPAPDAPGARAHWCADPLETLDPEAHARDGALWGDLLLLAYIVAATDPYGVFGLLRGLRAMGARLERTTDSIHLVPPAVASEEEMWAEWILDRGAEVRGLLKRVLDGRDAYVANG